MEKKKVLILYAPLGVGHEAAADSIAEAFLLRYPNIETKSVNVLDFTFDIFARTLPKVYVYLCSKIPFLYKWFYEGYKRRFGQELLNNGVDVMMKGSHFVDFIKDFNPDFIISTNPLPMHLVSKTKEENIINISSANVCTDFGFHSLWYNSDVNYYFVATKEIKNKLIEKGVSADAIIETGIPIKNKFSKKYDRQQIINKLGLDSSKPILMIVGGKIKYDNLIKIFRETKNKNKNAQFVIVAGRDKKLQKELNSSEIKKDSCARVFAFVDNLEELMSASDLVLTKAGGLTVAECLAEELPMVINDIIPGQEEDNVDYVIRNKVGVEAHSVKEAVEAITKLLSGSEDLQEMKENCQKIAKPDAAKILVDFVVYKINLYAS